MTESPADNTGEQKRVSLGDIAEIAGTHRDRVSRALNNDKRIRLEERERIQQIAAELGYQKTHHPGQHHNSSLTQERADIVVEGILSGKTIPAIAKEAGVSPVTAWKQIRGVKVPGEYPEDENGWREDVTSFMRIAIWKGTKRLAMEGMNQVDPRNVPVAVGILSDKLMIMQGQPTSIHAQVIANVTHRDLVGEIQRAKQEAAIDVEEVN